MSDIRKRGQCSARGDRDHHCTEQAGHRYAHYDATADVSWTDRSEDHRDGCTCDVCEPDDDPDCDVSFCLLRLGHLGPHMRDTPA